MKFVERRAFADPDIAAHKLVEIANSVEAVQHGRIDIEQGLTRPAIGLGHVATIPKRVQCLIRNRSFRMGAGQ